MHYCTLEVEHAYSCSSMSLLTYRELWEEDDRGGCSCDGRTLVHTGLPHLRNTSNTRTVDLSSAPAERKDEESAIRGGRRMTGGILMYIPAHFIPIPIPVLQILFHELSKCN